jgi:CPA2 family monovalent cation:H+ antiporter-2
MPRIPKSSPPPISAPHAACSSPSPTTSKAARWWSRPAPLNPKLNIIARAHSEAEVLHLKKHGASVVILSEHEMARAMVELVAPGGS